LGAFVEGPAAKFVGLLNKASYIFYLSGASSALLQPLSIFQTGMPVFLDTEQSTLPAKWAA